MGLSITAVRYYESLGILPPPARTASGYQLYTDADERLLHFVLHVKQAGLTLAEIRRIVRSEEGSADRQEVPECLRRRIASMDAQTAELLQFREALAAKAVRSGDLSDQQSAGELIERLASLPLPSREA